MTLGHNPEISNQRLDQFIEYHNANPAVWRYFKRTAHEIQGYSDKSSSKAIFEIIRYKFGMKGRDGFNLNNNFSSIYPRLLAAVDPSFENFFRFRGIKSQINDAAYDRENEVVHTVVLN